MKILYSIGLAMLLSVSAKSASANDSSAHLASGGLVFSRQPHVEMRSEDLFLSPDKVRVRYEFYNKSDKDVSTLVAFPLPEIGALDDTNNLGLVSEDPINFLEFKTRVNGQSIPMMLEQKAIALRVDQTKELQEFNLPLAPFLLSTAEAIKKLDSRQTEHLLSLGLIRKSDYDGGGFVPAWSLRTTFYWMQKFPAGKSVVIEHEYTPIAGRSLSPPINKYADAKTIEWAQREYCISDDMLTSMKELTDAEGTSAGYIMTSADLEYILTTGSNWAGPIGNFRLVIETDKPTDFASVCLEGIEQVANNRIELNKKNFWPWQNLKVFFLERMKLEQ